MSVQPNPPAPLLDYDAERARLDAMQAEIREMRESIERARTRPDGDAS